MAEELYRKLYYLSFSNEEETSTVIVRIIETFTQAMALKRTVVYLKSAEGYQVVAFSGDNVTQECLRNEGHRFLIHNNSGKEIGEIHIVPWEGAGFSLVEEKVLAALINQIAELLNRLLNQQDGACLINEIDRYKQLLSIDKLTGLYNRYKFEETMTIIERGKQYPISLVFVDIDGLKTINDYLGHKYGDIALKETAVLLKKAFRENDLIARIGGDEFVILLPQTQRKSAEMRCKSLIEALKVYNKDKKIPPLSFSVGIATTDGSETMQKLLHVADLEMYKQKQKNKLKYGNFLKNQCLSISADAGNTAHQQFII